jgi:hypothetical protein
MSLEKQLEANTLAIRELTAAILGAFSAQVALTPEPPFPGEHLYDTILTEFTALQSLDEKAATALVIGLGVRSISEVSASRYPEVLEHIAKFRAEVVKKLAASQESTTAPTAGTSSQEPASAAGATTGGDDGKKSEQRVQAADTSSATEYPALTDTVNIPDKPVFTEYQQVADEFLKLVKDKGREDATTGGDDGKKLEPSVRFAETTNISADGANATTDTATAKNSTEDKLDIYQEAADAILADKPVFTEYQRVADEFLKLVKDKGRDVAIELLTAYGVRTAKELKPEQYQAFGEDVLRIMGEALV